MSEIERDILPIKIKKTSGITLGGKAEKHMMPHSSR
jgi:hypothetical protein